jgi:hypothetical protein
MGWVEEEEGVVSSPWKMIVGEINDRRRIKLKILASKIMSLSVIPQARLPYTNPEKISK